MKKLLLLIGIMLSVVSCKTQYIPVPSSTSTTVNVKDSTVWNIKDSIRITEKSRYKDYGDLLKTLAIDGNHSHMKAWVDTTKNILNGELVEDEIKEKTRVEYRDKLVFKDSVRVEEKPVPYPVEVKERYIPKIYKILSGIGIISILSLLVFIGLKVYKLKGKSFLNIFKNLFKRPQF